MVNLLMLALFSCLMFQAVKLTVKIAWCGMKVLAVILFIAALPMLAICLLAAGGVLLLVPLGMLAGAIGLLSRCTRAKYLSMD